MQTFHESVHTFASFELLQPEEKPRRGEAGQQQREAGEPNFWGCCGTSQDTKQERHSTLVLVGCSTGGEPGPAAPHCCDGSEATAAAMADKLSLVSLTAVVAVPQR